MTYIVIQVNNWFKYYYYSNSLCSHKQIDFIMNNVLTNLVKRLRKNVWLFVITTLFPGQLDTWWRVIQESRSRNQDRNTSYFQDPKIRKKRRMITIRRRWLTYTNIQPDSSCFIRSSYDATIREEVVLFYTVSNYYYNRNEILYQ